MPSPMMRARAVSSRTGAWLQVRVQALGVAVLASASVKDAFHRLVRYSRIISDAAEYRLDDAGDRYRLFLDVAPTARLEHEAVDAIMSLEVRTIRALYSDRTVGPGRVARQRPEPSSTEAYRKFFRAPVTFAAARNVLELSRELVEAPLPSGQAELARHSDEVMSRPPADRSAEPGATRPRHRPRSSRRRRADAGERGAQARRRSAHPAAPARGGKDLVRRHRSADAPRSGDRLSARAGLVGHRGRLLSRLRRRQQLLARLSTLTGVSPKQYAAGAESAADDVRRER